MEKLILFFENPLVFIYEPEQIFFITFQINLLMQKKAIFLTSF